MDKIVIGDINIFGTATRHRYRSDEQPRLIDIISLGEMVDGLCDPVLNKPVKRTL